MIKYVNQHQLCNLYSVLMALKLYEECREKKNEKQKKRERER